MKTRLIMLRPLVMVAGLLLVVVGLVAGMRGLARLNPEPRTYLEPGDCQQPCWLNLRPGEVKADDVTAAAQHVTRLTVAVPSYSDGIARRFTVVVQNAVSLGDLLHVFGPPERLTCLQPNPGAERGVWRASTTLYWADGLVAAEVMHMDDMRLAPDMRVWDVTYFMAGEPAYPVGRTIQWQGFGSWRRYAVCWPEG